MKKINKYYILKKKCYYFSDDKTVFKSLNVEPILPLILPSTNPPITAITKIINIDTDMETSAVPNKLPKRGI